MKGPDHKGNSSKRAPFVSLPLWLMETAAWKHLSAEARALYVELKAQYKGINNGRIVFSTRQAAKALNLSKNTTAALFRELQEHGFIERMICGSFENRKDRKASEWRLTEHVCDVTGQLASKEFASWREGSSFTVPREGQGASQTGQGVPHRGLYGAHKPRAVPQGAL
ncbi:hypothetical protein [Methylobacterium nigriterrae]|uniref:hypothetical protein n=1 Tax=Methylobacterium nigriterrae TaxID=3127512 RepID=UPI0030139C6B